MNLDLLLENAKLTDGSTAHVGIARGRIASIDRITPTAMAGRCIDLDGALLVPSLIDGHMHLANTLLGDRWHPHRPCTDGFDVSERLRIQKEVLALASPVEERAGRLVKLAVSKGTGYIRNHVEIDLDFGLSHLEATLAVRARYGDMVTIQTIAMARGVLVRDGTLDLMHEALRNGAEVVGGLDPAGFEGDVALYLDTMFALAEEYGVGLDLHLHDGGALGLFELGAIAERTVALGMQGRVAVSHAYALGEASWDIVEPVAVQLAMADVSIMTNAPGDHAFPPVMALRDAGVNVFAGNDDIRDSWSPYGDADMLERVMLIGYRSGIFTNSDLNTVFDMATSNAAKALGVTDYGVSVGRPADLVALTAENVAEAVVARPPRRLVFKAGKLVAKDGELTDPKLEKADRIS